MRKQEFCLNCQSKSTRPYNLRLQVCVCVQCLQGGQWPAFTESGKEASWTYLRIGDVLTSRFALPC